MPKYYLEMNEILSAEDIFTKQPQTIRVEVADKDDAVKKAAGLEPLFAGRAYTKQYHICNHETGQSCASEAL